MTIEALTNPETVSRIIDKFCMSTFPIGTDLSTVDKHWFLAPMDISELHEAAIESENLPEMVGCRLDMRLTAPDFGSRELSYYLMSIGDSERIFVVEAPANHSIRFAFEPAGVGG